MATTCGEIVLNRFGWETGVKEGWFKLPKELEGITYDEWLEMIGWDKDTPPTQTDFLMKFKEKNPCYYNNKMSQQQTTATFVEWSEDFLSEQCYFCSCENDGWWAVEDEDAVCESCSKIWKYDEDDDGYNKVSDDAVQSPKN